MSESNRRQAAALVPGVAVMALVVAACAGYVEPPRSGATYQGQGGAINVDTPALRTLKASAGIASCPEVSSSAAAVDGGLPSLTLPCLGGGRPVDLAGLRGPLVVNFWAQYCGPCRQESPLLQKLSTAGHGDVRVIGVDFIDPRPETALAFAKDYGLTYPQVADPTAQAKGPLRIAAIPYTFFVDAAGKITYTQVGPIDSLTELVALVHDHLGVDLPALAGK